MHYPGILIEEHAQTLSNPKQFAPDQTQNNLSAGHHCNPISADILSHTCQPPRSTNWSVVATSSISAAGGDRTAAQFHGNFERFDPYFDASTATKTSRRSPSPTLTQSPSSKAPTPKTSQHIHVRTLDNPRPNTRHSHTSTEANDTKMISISKPPSNKTLVTKWRRWTIEGAPKSI